MKEFKGRTAFVTGAASGIGLGLARTFLDRGMNVMMADVEDAALKAARAQPVELRRPGRAACCCDVSVGEAITDAAHKTFDDASARSTFSATMPACRAPAASRKSRSPTGNG